MNFNDTFKNISLWLSITVGLTMDGQITDEQWSL